MLCEFARLAVRSVGDTLDKPIGAGFKMLREANECGDAEGVFSAFDAPDAFGVNAHQLGEAFLRQIRPSSGGGHVATDDTIGASWRPAAVWQDRGRAQKRASTK